MTIELTKLVHDCSTGESTVLPLTAEEIIQLEKDRAEWQQVIEEREAVAQALATLKASAKAKLIAGEPLTAEEANTLII